MTKRDFGAAALAGLCVLGGCGGSGEAPVEPPLQRGYDYFQGAATVGETAVVVGSNGAVLVQANGQWSRTELPGKPELIDVVACAGGFAALDFGRRLWVSDDGRAWQPRPIDTGEETLTLACDPQDRVWVAGSYATLWMSPDRGSTWSEHSLDEDAQITALRFVTADLAYAGGEFGLLLRTEDGGASWERVAGLPEVYVQDLHFTDRENGFVASSGGLLLRTTDGGASWQRERVSVDSALYRFAFLNGALHLAGDRGTLLARRGGRWLPVDYGEPVSAHLRALTGPVRGRLVVAGGQGVVREVAPAQAQP